MADLCAKGWEFGKEGFRGLLGISSAIEGIIFKKILIERLQGKGEERNRYSAQLCSMIKRSKVGRKEDRFDGMAR